MIGKRFLQMVKKQEKSEERGHVLNELKLQIAVHYGIPYTASILAFDPIQRLLAIGTLDGRIKIIGGDNIEGLFLSPKKVPYKHLEFMHNRGFLVGVSNDNEIQIWNLELRQLVHSLQWEVNVTAFAVVYMNYFMYVGDENGFVSVIKYDVENEKLLKTPYNIPQKSLAESAGILFPDTQPVVGLLPQPDNSWTRLLIAYEKGLLVLWDIFKNSVLTVRGYADLQLKGEKNPLSVTTGNDELQRNTANYEEEEENEICSLCWASTTGSVLAVGYINGDILLWNMSSSSLSKGKPPDEPSKNVVKLELASGRRRLPVIVLHWAMNNKADVDKGGQLFVYGGDEIGSEEVLTILNLDWSSGLENLKCISRVDLKLDGSFADMILIPNAGVLEKNSTAAVFVLTNPGQLNIYDGALLHTLKAEDNPSAQAEKFPVTVPAIDPCMTISKLFLVTTGSSSKGSLKKINARRVFVPTLSSGAPWPLTGGVPTEMFSEEYAIEKLLVAGYQDGSVRIWDATQPILTLMFVLEEKLPITTPTDVTNVPVSALGYCSISMTLAVGNETGLVCLYKLRDSDGSSFHFVTEANREVCTVHGKGFHYLAAIFIVSSPVKALQFTNAGDNIIVGFESGQVLMFEVTTLSQMFCTDCVSKTNSPLITLSSHFIMNIFQTSSQKLLDNASELVFTLAKDSSIVIFDSRTGTILSSKMLKEKNKAAAISMYVIEGSVAVSQLSGERSGGEPDETSQDNIRNENPDAIKTEVEGQCSSDRQYSSEILMDPLLVLCFPDALFLYSLKSVIEGNSSYMRKVNLVKQCCWSAIFKRNEKTSGLILVYDVGCVEIRSLPGFEVIGETTLMSILRWSFKTHMDRTMSSSENGQIALVNGSEFALISLSDGRVQEPLPCLHDNVLAAAADAAINLSKEQKKRQNTSPGILGGILRGLKGGRPEVDVGVAEGIPRCSSAQQLEELFSRLPFTTQSNPADDETTEFNLDDIVIDDIENDDIEIDDIEIDDIDDTLPAPSTSSDIAWKNRRDEEKEREKLFHGSSQDIKPRVRSQQEILTQYKFKGDATAAAAHAREKLAERQEKLQKLSERTAELQSGAENFSSMASELVKAMENKKWWKL